MIIAQTAPLKTATLAEEFQESQSLLQAMAEANPHVFYIYDLIEQRNVYTNRQLHTSLGYTPQEIEEMGMVFLTSLIHPDDLVALSNHFQQFETVQDGEILEIEYRMRHKNGEYRWFYSRDTLFTRTAEGQAKRILGTATDITKRKHIEEELKKNQDRLQLALEASEMGLWDWQIRTGEVYFSPQWKMMLGYEVGEIENRLESWERLVHPDDLPRAWEEITAYLEGHSQRYSLEFRMRSKTDEWRWILSQAKVMECDTSGIPLRVTGTHKDISDKKWAELALTQTKVALEQHLQRILLQERITYEIRSSWHPAQFFQSAVTQIGQAFNVDRCLVHTYIEAPIPQIPLVAEYKREGMESLMGVEVPMRGNLHAEELLARDRAVVVDNVYAEPLLEPMLFLCEELGLKSMLGVRTSYQGKPNGLIGVHQYDYFRHWHEDEISLLEAVAAQLGIAIAQANLLEQERQHRLALDRQNRQLQKEIRVRQQTEEALKRSEERWQLVLQGNNDGIWDWNLKTNKAFRSPRLKEILGYADWEISDENDEWIRRIHPDDFERVMRTNLEYLTRKIPHYSIEYRLRCKDDDYKWVLSRAQAVWDEAGNPVRMVASTKDISEHKKSQAALAASEQKYRDLVETSQDMIWSMNTEGCLTFVNSAVKQIYGYDPSEMIGRPFTDFKPLTQIDQDLEAFLRLLDGKTIFQYETQHLAKDGKLIHLMINAIALTDERGNVIGITGTASDITIRKQIEEALRESETRYRELVEFQDQLLVCRWNPDTTLTFVNQTYCRFLGQPSTALIGTKFLDWLPNPSTREQVMKFVRSLVDCLHSQTTEYPMVSATGETHWFCWTNQPLFNQEGYFVEFQSFGIDITERKLAEEALRQSEAREREKAQALEIALGQLKHTQTQLLLSEKMASLGQLVAGVAHEINNPVGFIYTNIYPATGYARDLLHLIELYQRYYPEPIDEITRRLEEIDIDFIAEDFPKLLESMKMGSERIAQIVMSLRNFSRLDHAEKKRVDIHEGINNTLFILQHRLKQQTYRPEIQVIQEYGQLPKVECYPGQLNQVFMNLLNNAIDAIEESNKSEILNHSRESFNQSLPIIQIHTSMIDNQNIMIRIADNGVGIKTELQQKIFDPFFTTKPVGKGTGLGLSLSYQIVVDRHGGKMRCHSVAGQGTELVIELPISQSQLYSSTKSA